MILPQVSNSSDAVNASDNGVEFGAIASRVFSPCGSPRIQWRPGSSFQNEGEQQSISDDSISNSAPNAGLGKNAAKEEDSKLSHTLDMQGFPSCKILKGADFEDDEIVHVNGQVDPKSDIDVINLELSLLIFGSGSH